MRWAVVGAGAIGTYVGAQLVRSGEDVTFLARGPQLAVLQRDGLTVRDGARSETLRVRATASADEIGPVDAVVLALKAHVIEGALETMRVLCEPSTTIVAVQNGIPWWYTLDHRVVRGAVLESVDPGGRIESALGGFDVLSALMYVAVHVPTPGTVVNTHGDRIVLGYARGRSEFAMATAAALERTAFSVRVGLEPRRDVWEKLLGNAAFNPLSVLVRATMRRIMAAPGVVEIARQMMRECLAVAAALGDAPAIDLEARIAASPLDDTKTSMLQDFEAGRPLELGPVLGAVIELGKLVRVPTPLCSDIYALVALVDAQLRDT